MRIHIIGASLGKPHAYRYYEKIIVLVCVFVSTIRRPQIVSRLVCRNGI